MQHLEQKFGLRLFDRFNLAYREGDAILSAPRHAFEEKIKQKSITADTTVFNNLVQNLQELNTKWEVPFKESWHQQLFGSLLV